MKIKTRDWPAGDCKTLGIPEYVTRAASGGSYGNGTLEDIRDAAENACAALGRLLDLMARRGTLTAPEVSWIAEDHFSDETAEFVPEEEGEVE
jgi:hypothetical protein